MGCSSTCAKIFLLVFNFVFWLCGGALIALYIYMRVEPKIYHNFNLIKLSHNEIDIALYVMLGIGIFAVFVGFLGCFGAIKQSKCLLGVYMLFLVLLMAAQLAGGFLVSLYKSDIELALKQVLRDTIELNYRDAPNEIGVSWDFVQFELKCCGVDSAYDYDESAWLKRRYLEGCYNEFIKYLRDHLTMIIIAVGVVALVQVIAFIAAACLCRHSRLKTYRHH